MAWSDGPKRNRRAAACTVGVAAAALLVACEPAPPRPVLVVHTAVDGPDAVPGDGVCEITAGSGDCSLRAAVDEANAVAGAAIVRLVADPVLSVAGREEDANAAGDIDVSDTLELQGDGHTIDAAGLDRVLDIRAGTVISGVTITGGAGVSDGAGIRQTEASLVAIHTTVRDNAAVTFGGGIAFSGVEMALDSSTISSNRTGELADPLGNQGGGIYVGRGRVRIVNSTMSGNRAGAGGAVATAFPFFEDIAAHVSIAGSTIVDNTGDQNQPGCFDVGCGAVNNPPDWTYCSFAGCETYRSGEIELQGTALSNPGANCYGGTSLGHNVARTANGCLGAATDLVGVDLALGPLADNGGGGLTHLPALGSPLIDAVPPGTPGLCDGSVPTDQRGVPRPTGSGCDIGAVEVQ